MKTPMTQEYLKSIFRYDLLTGDFIWRINKGSKAKKGCVAKSIFKSCGKKYITIYIDGKHCLAHRLAFLYVLSELPRDDVDHINGNGLDNRWINLRHATKQENSKNQRKYSSNTSGFTGITWDKRKSRWRSRINVNKNEIYLGVFSDIKDAIKSRKDANKKYRFHENHGQVRPL